MTNLTWKDLREVRRREKDPRVRDRMLAVHLVVNKDRTYEETANLLMQCPRWAAKWVARFR